MENITIGIVAGGTGGHFYPSLSIALELKARGYIVIMYISGQNKYDHQTLAEQNGLQTKLFESFHVKELLLKPWKLFGEVRKLKKNFISRKVNLVLGMGSFVAFPAGLAAFMTKIPLVLHEGNAIPGKCNVWLSRFATAVAISLPLANPAKIHCKNIVQTGVPLQKSIINNVVTAEEKLEFYKYYNLDPARKTLLIFGGSQGAKFINNLIYASLSLPEMKELLCKLQVLHFTGAEDNELLIARYNKSGVLAYVKHHENKMLRAYSLTDLTICRSGVSTICELDMLQKKAIFIPLPFVSDDHQTGNANIAVKAGLGMLLPQSQATAEVLASHLKQWLNDELKFSENTLGYNISYPDAAKRVADLLENVLNGNFAK